MAEEPNGSILSRRSSIWLKDITSSGLAKLLAFETSRTALRPGRDLYKRLRKDDFRILNIEQYEASGIAAAKRHSCCLSTHKLSSFPNEDGYAAVSYTWKSHAQRWNFGLDHASVEVQGQVFPAAARVAPMLASLYESGFRNVWIDALCINQLDVSERSNQVARMRQIYSNASQVVVFLGSGSPNTDALFDFLNHGSIKGLRMSSAELSGLLEVVSNPYWQRAWIIQEVAVARSVVLICGAKRTSWDRLVHSMARWDVSEWARPISSGSDFPGREIRMIDNFRTERHGSLIEVLQKTRSSKASNALDVIYAKLGLANDASTLVSRVTYSIDASTLFKSIVKRHVTAKHDLYIICLVRERQEDGVHLPSWVPDWTKSTNRYPLLRFFFSGWVNITHQAHAKMNVSFSNDLNEIRVLGLLLDTLGPSASSNLDKEAAGQSAREMFPSICRAALAAHFVLPRQSESASIPREFVDLFASTVARLEDEDERERTHTKRTLHRTLYAMADAQDTDQRPWEVEHHSNELSTDDFRRWHEANRKVVIAGRTVAAWAKAYSTVLETGDKEVSGSENLSTGGLERSLTAMAWNRKLTSTVSGRPALVPEAAIQGDLVCALYGCPVLVVLRQNKHYIFIGECFVEDFMDEKQHFSALVEPMREMMFNLR
ncbi:hypothetical protein M409DRAFT_28663 [Zasmidium cellare ATCC 36951]|uniref:Heterokaryon incompatibility domain-containing protein n=1 Tax=Zasmidium cellare ATCC 36951 TaxID=1080233 RepID=A0A6A6C3M4_ZASCE|nr:uncharacterized protein M409DRAFT_28663 [Zasmidium cellare ATCC 36951]KAF2160780.1 hypothetical protein M409DRAFT_28663 [Zasmidium cellare ATCC 36951]